MNINWYQSVIAITASLLLHGLVFAALFSAPSPPPIVPVAPVQKLKIAYVSVLPVAAVKNESAALPVADKSPAVVVENKPESAPIPEPVVVKPKTEIPKPDTSNSVKPTPSKPLKPVKPVTEKTVKNKPKPQIKPKPKPKTKVSPKQQVEKTPPAPAKPTDKPIEKPADKPTDKPTDKPAAIQTQVTQPASTAKTSLAAAAGIGTQTTTANTTGQAAAQQAAQQHTLSQYRSQLQAWLEKHKRYPKRALRKRIEGEAALKFSIDRQGNVLSYELRKSTGNPLLDQEISAMLKRATPMPVIPAALNERTMEFIIPVNFNIN